MTFGAVLGTEVLEGEMDQLGFEKNGVMLIHYWERRSGFLRERRTGEDVKV